MQMFQLFRSQGEEDTEPTRSNMTNRAQPREGAQNILESMEKRILDKSSSISWSKEQIRF